MAAELYCLTFVFVGTQYGTCYILENMCNAPGLNTPNYDNHDGQTFNDSVLEWAQ